MLSQADPYDEFQLSWDLGKRKAFNWEVDWKDTEPISIDSIELYDEHVKVNCWWEFLLDFMVNYYYYLECLSVIMGTKENRMKASKFIPAPIKDVEVFLKTVNETLEKHEINRLEFIWEDLSNLCGAITFPYITRFSACTGSPVLLQSRSQGG